MLSLDPPLLRGEKPQKVQFKVYPIHVGDRANLWINLLWSDDTKIECYDCEVTTSTSHHLEHNKLSVKHGGSSIMQ